MSITVAHIKHGTQIKVIIGKAVFQELEDDRFCQAWDQLYQACPWATVFQSRTFVSTFYHIFREDYIPILVKGILNGELIGFLPLVQNPGKKKKDQYLIGAGHLEVDYHCWVSRPEDNKEFARGALEAIQEKFPHQKLILRHLPESLPHDWYEENPGLQKYCNLQPVNHPLVDLSQFKVSKRDRKRINRLMKFAAFEEVEEYSCFEAIIDDIGSKSDFRYGARYYHFPYRGLNHQKEFLLDLFAKGMLRVSVLRDQDKLIAGMITLKSKQYEILGVLNFHDPSYSYHSPGYVQFVLLFKQLSAQGVGNFFLTPGDDPYKSRLATQVGEVYQLTFTRSSKVLMKLRVKAMLHSFLLKKKINPYELKLKIDKVKYFYRQLGVVQLLKKYLGEKNSDNNGLMLRHKICDYILAQDLPPIKVDDEKHLLSFNREAGERVTRWEFLEDSMQRLEKGQKVFTWQVEDRLMAACWSEEEQEPQARLSGLYFSPFAKNSEMKFLSAVFHHLAKQGHEEVSLALHENQQVLRQLLEKQSSNSKPKTLQEGSEKKLPVNLSE